uniref:Uncharacterized protein n=1 Tax=Panagrolaimus sp. ES5 TaxID=591445 RepID=A0AC34FNC6_9BILA
MSSNDIANTDENALSDNDENVVTLDDEEPSKQKSSKINQTSPGKNSLNMVKKMQNVKTAAKWCLVKLVTTGMKFHMKNHDKKLYSGAVLENRI